MDSHWKIEAIVYTCLLPNLYYFFLEYLPSSSTNLSSRLYLTMVGPKIQQDGLYASFYVLVVAAALRWCRC